MTNAYPTRGIYWECISLVVIGLMSVLSVCQTYGQEEAAPQAIQTKQRCPLVKQLVCVSGQDEIWLVSARQAHQCAGDLSQVCVSQLQNERWQPSSLQALTSQHSKDKSKATFVYCHGNRTDFDWAKSRGLQVYQSVFQPEDEKASCRRPPVRFVIFAWKSEQEKIRIRPDYQIKSKRALVVGKTLGKFLGQFDDRNMVLSGFSLGSQVLLTGLSSCELDQSNAIGRYQVALVAPALDASFVCNSLSKLPENCWVQRTEVFANENDRAIKAAQKIAAKTCKEWLPEFKKLACSSASAVNPIHVYDVAKDISRQHSTNNYYTSDKVRCVHHEMLVDVYASSQPGFQRTDTEELTPVEFSDLILQTEETLEVEPVATAPIELKLTPGHSN